jgi:hypothetical protein
MKSVDQIIQAIAELPANEMTALNEVMAARATGGKTSAADIDDALASIPGFAAPLRRSIVEALTAKGVIGKVSAAASNDRVRTPNAIRAASSEAEPLLNQLRGELRRVGYDLQDDEPVDLVKLDAALRACTDLTRRFYLRTALAQTGLIN